MATPGTPKSGSIPNITVPTQLVDPAILTAPAKDNRVWTDQEEYLLSLWADRALCYKLIHEESQSLYQKYHKWFTIPVIILATLTGTANVAIAAYVPIAYMAYAQLVIGVVNLSSGVLSTVQNYLRSAEKAESHRHAAISWGKLYRSIYVEMSLSRDKRKPVTDFMRMSKNEYDRLIDNNPNVKRSIFMKFSARAANNPSIILPEECGNLLHASSWEHVSAYRLHVMETRGNKAEEDALQDTLQDAKSVTNSDAHLDSLSVEVLPVKDASQIIQNSIKLAKEVVQEVQEEVQEVVQEFQEVAQNVAQETAQNVQEAVKSASANPTLFHLVFPKAI